MRIAPEQRPLMIAITVSVLAHLLLLALRFQAPAAARRPPEATGMEVILVNAKHARKPLQASAVAQANLDGGGKADSGRATSPLPDLQKNRAGDAAVAFKRRIEELEQRREQLLTQARLSDFKADPLAERDKPDPKAKGGDLAESSRALARMAAEISQDISEQNKRPHKTYLTPSTVEAGYALYYKEMQHRIEEIGTLNFPQKDGKKLYGELIVEIPIFQDGTIYEKEGGIKVRRSSGNPDLDAAALRIIRRAAPFGRFPKQMLSNGREDLWVVTTTFKFARSDQLETGMIGTRP
ncbi:TonB family protein [Massilia sp. TS11]|uniref:TonB family protein n=1 Tax=Massilia sp. TS11 TaxID=2908003 RepID=UPI001EDC820F|nr:TonB family protein [Massilia sp. TS11]MCG2583445.1 TonB C-terminal domain-containing protein [Massilia sp. TS11]